MKASRFVVHRLLSLPDKQLLFTNLSLMLASGISLLEAFESLQIEMRRGQKILFSTICKELAEGKTLADSLSLFPNDFDHTIVEVIRSSEQAGTLEQTVGDVAHTLEKQIEFEEKIKAAITYPIFVLIICGLVVLLMLLFVIPRMATVFERLRVPLPPVTAGVVFLSSTLIEYPGYILLVSVFTLLLCFFIWRYHKRLFVQLLSLLPWTYTLIQHTQLSTFCRNTSLLLKAGVPITQALGFTTKQFSQPQLIKAAKVLLKKVNAGQTFSLGLAHFPKQYGSMMLRLVEVGERTGKLELCLEKASRYFEKEVDRELKRVTVLLEPVLIVFLGVVVGGIMLSIVAPIYSLIGQIG